MKPKDTKEEINKLKKEWLSLLRKNIFIFTLGNMLFISGLKISGLGFPYIKDKTKQYNYSVTTINNKNNNIIVKEKYLDRGKILKNKENDNLIYIKDKYSYDNNYYSRNVKVYKLDEKNNYEEVLKNYKKYIKSSNLLNEYKEKSNQIDDKLYKDKEVIIKYYDINKDDFIYIDENNINNILSSSIYTIILLIYGVEYIYYTLYDLKEINTNIKKLKRR